MSDRASDPSLPPEPLLLAEASVQEVVLELIRRTRFNRFDGRRVVASLRRHRDLWRAVLFRSDGLPPAGNDDGLGPLSLLTLRDLPGNRWHADRLFALCADVRLAHRVLALAESDQWLADEAAAYEPSPQVTSALGTSRPAAVAELWWD